MSDIYANATINKSDALNTIRHEASYPKPFVAHYYPLEVRS